ncbi:MAG: hypothetical protein HETSPECPRED_002236 [Heterodermia speciosa]|uniref:Uncharacterized protein n=1 Tax=Heterodermia speciosa TaxID=116794 RepID=A0A8H3F0F6_9LECA|nr:MAG: hypothetical protein HETSPECPRED_002236 [Heterodermia speciosa]
MSYGQDDEPASHRPGPERTRRRRRFSSVELDPRTTRDDPRSAPYDTRHPRTARPTNMPNGDMPNGDMPNGDMPNGDMPNGDMPNGERGRPTAARGARPGAYSELTSEAERFLSRYDLGPSAPLQQPSRRAAQQPIYQLPHRSARPAPAQQQPIPRAPLQPIPRAPLQPVARSPLQPIPRAPLQQIHPHRPHTPRQVPQQPRPQPPAQQRSSFNTMIDRMVIMLAEEGIHVSRERVEEMVRGLL